MVIKYKSNLVVADGVNATISLADFTEMYIVTGSDTLTSSWAITVASGSAAEGMTCFFFWKADIDFNSQTVQILGETIPASFSEKEFLCIAVYENSAWSVSVLADMLQTSGGLPIEYEDLELTDSIDNSDIKTAAGIDYSKLSLATSILNGDISASAAIALTKLAATTASRLMVSGAGGFLEPSVVTAVEAAYISGLTSAVQAQLDVKLESGDVDNATVAATAAIALTKLAAMTPAMALVTDLTGFIVPSAVSAAEQAHLIGTTAPIQTQLNSLTTKILTEGSINIGSAADESTPLSIKTNAQFIIGNGTTGASQPLTNAISVTNAGVVTINSNYVAPSMQTSDSRKDCVTINASFETGYLGSKKIRVPYKSELIYVYSSVDLAIEASNEAILNFKDHLGNNMGGGSLSSGNLIIAAGSAMGTTDNSLVDANNSFAAGESLIIETRKSTAGGTVWLTLEFEKID